MRELDDCAAAIAQKLMALRQTVSVAESSTGGLISAALLRVPGASAYYVGGAVVYTARARAALMQIDRLDVEGMRSASEPYAALLAERTRGLLRTHWAIAETGAAGPSGNPYGDVAGHVCYAVAGPAPAVRTLKTGLSNRADNMRRFATAALELFDARLETIAREG